MKPSGKKLLTRLVLSSLVFPAPSIAETYLQRLATVPLGAEITGLYITEAGDLFMNAQHPADSNSGINRATIGVINGVDFRTLPASIPTLNLPKGEAKQQITTALGTYQILAQEGDFSDQIKDGIGAIHSVEGRLLKASNNPDFNGFIATNAAASEGHLFTNWEDRPGGMSRMKLGKRSDGWIVESAEMLDFSSVNGTWVNCFGSVTPWNTPLTSEELYFDHTADWIDPFARNYSNAINAAAYFGDKAANPYHFGYIMEITEPSSTPKPVKHFTMGRFSHENAVVMPDAKTAYLSDDGTGTVLFKFVADTAGDLGAGTLYAAKVTQQGEAGSDVLNVNFLIDWIKLAHSDNATIADWIAEYNGISPDSFAANGKGYISDEEIVAWANGEAKDDRAAFLESRKAAVAKGATGEFRKMEGVMINQAGAAAGTVPSMYLAMSEISKHMSDGKGDIDVTENRCGAVFELPLEQDFNTLSMRAIVAGYGYDTGNAPNTCSTDGIASPDNLLVLDDGRLLIGEDTGLHENNMLWIYSPANL